MFTILIASVHPFKRVKNWNLVIIGYLGFEAGW